MPSVTARDALAYATTEAWMKLYAVLLAAWLLSLLGQVVLQFRFILTGLIAAVLLLVATVLVVVWLVAAAFKLLVDTRQPAAEA